MSKRRKTMTYFLKEDYEIYDSLPCSAVVFSVDDDYKIYYTNDTYNNGNFNQDNIIVEEECRKLFDDTIRSADTPKRLYFKSKNLSGGSIYICMFAVKLMISTYLHYYLTTLKTRRNLWSLKINVQSISSH